MEAEYRLGEYFTGFAVKRLAGEAETSAAEKRLVFKGTAAMISVFGDTERNKVPAVFLFRPDERDMRWDEGFLNWQSWVSVSSG